MDLQTLHVSQLYETVTTFGLLLLTISQIIVLQKQLYEHVAYVRKKENQLQDIWVSARLKDTRDGNADANVQGDLEKSAIDSLRKEMSQYQNKNMQPEPQPLKQPLQPPQPRLSSLSNPPFPIAQPSLGRSPSPSQIRYTQSMPNLPHVQSPTSSLSPSQTSTMLFCLEYQSFLSQHISIILPILVLGMLTNSTRIFSLACFFCYLFASLVFDFLHLEERVKAQYKKGIVMRRVVKILSNCFVAGLFINYWVIGETLLNWILPLKDLYGSTHFYI